MMHVGHQPRGPCPSPQLPTWPSKTRPLKIGPGCFSAKKVSRCMRSFSASSSRVCTQPWSRLRSKHKTLDLQLVVQFACHVCRVPHSNL